MSTDSIPTSRGPVGPGAALAAVVGLLGVGYGVLLTSVSVLGGTWIAAVGLSLVLSGLVTTAWVGRRFGLAPAVQRRASVAFGALAFVLLVAFVAVNGATFDTGTATGSTAGA